MKPLVRKAQIGDLVHIVNNNIAIAKETEALELNSERVLKGTEAVLIDAAKGFYLVAEANEKVVGSVMITYEWSDWHNGNRWWIQSLYVQPDFRRKGVFSGLLLKLRLLAEEEKALELMLYVIHSNASAQQAYLNQGFEDSGYRMMCLPILKKK